jgi:xylan 1,4-beta-xylosidase
MLFRQLFLPLFAVLVLPPGLAQSPRETVLSIDAHAAGRPFPHAWEQMFGSGRAILSLRESYRDDLRQVRAITGFGYVRFHGILDDEVGVYGRDHEGKAYYNFSYVDQIYDGLLSSGVRPFVEISFMPKLLAANPTPHAFWYKPYPSPPNDPAEWAELITAFTQHLVARYGTEEVAKWYFEVWNEPNIDFWTGDPKEETYYALYDVTARAIKKVDPDLRVGGPSTAQAAWVDRFIQHCHDSQTPFDFVSTHIYGNEDPVNVFGNSTPVARKDMVAAAIRKVHDQVAQSTAPQTPIIISEYNATYLNQSQVTDSAFMGPWLANNIRECDGLASMMSYWAFSDVFEEQGVIQKPFYGGYGIVAEREIPKAAFRAFELLHQLGDQRLMPDTTDAIITRRGNGATLVLALWNYAEPGQKPGPQVFRLKLSNTNAKKYRLQILDPAHGSALAAWNTMGKPSEPSLAQIARLKEASKLAPATEHRVDEPIKIEAQGLALVVIQ